MQWSWPIKRMSNSGSFRYKRQRAALVTHCPPEPPWSGERRRVAATQSYLAERYDCDVLLCSTKDAFIHRARRKVRRPLAPPYAARFQPPKVHLAGEYDVVWVFELWALTCIPRRLWSRVVWDKDTLMGASYASGNPQARLMSGWVSTYERYALRSVRHAFLSLPSDVRLISRSNVTLLPPGFDGTLGPRSVVREGNRPMRLGFVGLLGHEPNRRGLMWFVEDVLPKLRRAEPFTNVELWIAGMGLPDADKETIRRVGGVELKGYVEDLSDFYESVDVVIAPLLYGQGAPTKVVEALGQGLPVAGTASGLRGLAPELREWCFEASGAQWHDAIQRALGARESVAAREWQQRFAWPSVFKHYVDPVLGTTS